MYLLPLSKKKKNKLVSLFLFPYDLKTKIFPFWFTHVKLLFWKKKLNSTHNFVEFVGEFEKFTDILGWKWSGFEAWLVTTAIVPFFQHISHRAIGRAKARIHTNNVGNLWWQLPSETLRHAHDRTSAEMRTVQKLQVFFLC